ncbi:protein FAR1-RELATED SEQUENCE 5-like [Carya illinoinensis]|uniref:protein FAR1-RELATED SEQUENCE 5-like n=1 Tax=Carya illinoinensis TaxID=32201 RepID=UPI001C725412|nr:protein FAR1-RELATED SEQUENCE 5-like [Carya illinoinensis]
MGQVFGSGLWANILGQRRGSAGWVGHLLWVCELFVGLFGGSVSCWTCSSWVGELLVGLFVGHLRPHTEAPPRPPLRFQLRYVFGLGMGKGEEHASPLTSCSLNPQNSDIRQTSLPNFPNYMHGYFGPVPAWSAAFQPYPDGNKDPSNIQQNVGYPYQYGMRPPMPFVATSSAPSALTGQEEIPDAVETEAQCTSAQVDSEIMLDSPDEWVTDDGTPDTAQVVSSSNGEDMIQEPKSRMKFNSFEDLLSYYKHYAKQCGFGVMTQRSERSEDQSVRYVTLGCARGGKARIKSSNVANPRPTGKTDCKARINALRVEGKMQLTTVHNTHNHHTSPQKSRCFRCNREVSDTVKRVLDTNDLAGIRLNKSYGSLVVGAGGAGALRDYFLRMQYKNNGFFALMDLDDEGRLRNVFWADPRIQAAYKYFGDVVTFDTTYLTNRYGMPFAPFVGVNHHGQSILLGVGLISNEDTETFTWLFQTWLQCMDAYKSGLKMQLMKCVYDSQTIEAFEKCWAEFISTYELHENLWLKSLYAEREHWTNLKEFVDQFDSALKKKIENENQAEFQSFSGIIPCVFRSPIEKKFQELYTNAKFKEVQQQVIGVLDLDPSLLTSDGVMKSYLVEYEVRIQEYSKQVTYSVQFNVNDCNAKCSCGLFEIRGIMCRHILAVFKCNSVKVLPDRYILDRWRKDIKRRYTLIRTSYDAGDQRPTSNRYSILLNMCYGMIDYAVDSNDQFEDAKKRILEMTEAYRPEPDLLIMDTTAVGSSQQVKNPRIVRGKGRPPSLRRASRMETDMRKVKAKQKKSQQGEKRKEREEGEKAPLGTRRNLFDEGDTTSMGTCINFFGPSDVDNTIAPGQVLPVLDSPTFESSGIHQRESVMESQESVKSLNFA